MTIHWCGTGLSSGPGLRRLLSNGHKVAVWNRTVEKAREVVGNLTQDIRAFTVEALTAALQPGDIAISMLPVDQHVNIARACLARGANFVSSSYISPEMRALEPEFRAKGLVSVNEVGLDPGIDHLMAHDVVGRYKASAAYQPDNIISFTSYCGGVPKIPNPFKYKFSWAPVGVLKALRSPSRSLSDFKELKAARPWDAITAYDAPLPTPESFEVYPNRDSYPFMEDYNFGKDWKVKDFVRGTIRLNGWAEAWSPVFREIETLSGPTGDARLADMAAEFLKENSYSPGEPDRVVLFVSLKAARDGKVAFHETWCMDAWGDELGTAMGRLVSVPVSIAVEAVQRGEFSAGVHAAPHEAKMIADWLGKIKSLAQYMERVAG